jgi:hypothetical protein
MPAGDQGVHDRRVHPRTARDSLTFEEGTWAAWLHDLLKPHVSRRVVCDPRKAARLKEGNQSDRIDARTLAEWLRTKQLKPVYHEEHGIRALSGFSALREDRVSQDRENVGKIRHDWVIDLVQDDVEIQLSQHAGDGAFGCAINVRLTGVDGLFRKCQERGLDVT